jgi:hypothetical protein
MNMLIWWLVISIIGIAVQYGITITSVPETKQADDENKTYNQDEVENKKEISEIESSSIYNCPYCNCQVTYEMKFCPHCGKELNIPESIIQQHIKNFEPFKRKMQKKKDIKKKSLLKDFILVPIVIMKLNIRLNLVQSVARNYMYLKTLTEGENHSIKFQTVFCVI